MKNPITSARVYLDIARPKVTPGRVATVLSLAAVYAWTWGYRRLECPVSTYSAWSCTLLLLVRERAEITLVTSTWFASWTYSDRVVRAIRGTAEALGWLAVIAWAVEGRLR